jgi:RHS repeat-associated protein
MNRSNNKYYYHFDGLGSVTSLTNSNENVAVSYQYDAFGIILHESGSINNPFKFTSREHDKFIGLYYYRARHYDQTKGRFLQKDPMGMIDGTNSYCYVINNPVNFIDCYGLFTANLGRLEIDINYHKKNQRHTPYYVAPMYIFSANWVVFNNAGNSPPGADLRLDLVTKVSFDYQWENVFNKHVPSTDYLPGSEKYWPYFIASINFELFGSDDLINWYYESDGKGQIIDFVPVTAKKATATSKTTDFTNYQYWKLTFTCNYFQKPNPSPISSPTFSGYHESINGGSNYSTDYTSFGILNPIVDSNVGSMYYGSFSATYYFQ